jgi:hypothetical protein
MNRLLFLAPQYAFTDIISSLPETWANEFIDWATAKFDNDIPLDNFITIERAPTTSPVEPIRLFREWLRGNRRG